MNNTITQPQPQQQTYVLDQEPLEKAEYKEYEEQEQKEKQQPMGDVYDVYGKAVGVHSKLSGMTEDYTLTRYDIDIYNQKMPKFIREQRKILRIIKSYLIIPIDILRNIYQENKAQQIHKALLREYKIVEELLIGELDECVIMGRTPKGEVIDAFLKHGMTPQEQEEYETDTETQTIKKKLNERTKQ